MFRRKDGSVRKNKQGIELNCPLKIDFSRVKSMKKVDDHLENKPF